MKKLLQCLLLATLAVAPGSALAQGKPIELNMRRPALKTVEFKVPHGATGLAGGPVTINFIFDGTVPLPHQAFFNTAAATWVNRIPFYKTGVSNPPGITISVSEPPIDGAGGILGSAGPTTGGLAMGNFYTVTGQMAFDNADVAVLIGNNTYDDVIEHEMGHVLGVGTLWGPGFNNVYDEVNDPGKYTGANGLAAWQTYFSGQGAATFVPVELGGGPGTAHGHWNEVDGGGVATGITDALSGQDMQFETMTGWLDAPLVYTALTHRSMVDLGYDANPGLVPIELSDFTVE